jgi:hypothetical protein
LPVTLPETIVRRRCAALIPYARNARTHSDQQVAQIAASIREFGFTNPVLIDEEDGIIAGHGRVLAAHLLGLDEVPCIILAHLTPTQRRAYVLADNKLALNAGWDLEMLSLEIGELGEAGCGTLVFLLYQKGRDSRVFPAQDRAIDDFTLKGI